VTRTLHTIRVATVLLMLSTGAVACSSSDGDATSTTTTAPAPTALLEGTWRTAPVSLTGAEATLRGAGLSEWIEELRARAPFEDDTVLVLEIGEEWDLYGEPDDGPRAEIDFDASYEVDGDEVVVTHSAGSNTFRWEIAGDTLTFEHLASTMPAFEGVPEEVFQRALYMTAEFTRDR
jgi:hypothetical protein